MRPVPESRKIAPDGAIFSRSQSPRVATHCSGRQRALGAVDPPRVGRARGARGGAAAVVLEHLRVTQGRPRQRETATDARPCYAVHLAGEDLLQVMDQGDALGVVRLLHRALDQGVHFGIAGLVTEAAVWTTEAEGAAGGAGLRPVTPDEIVDG